jgi:hypothetical protein
MARYFEPGEPVEVNVPEGERLWHARAFVAELASPIEMAVAAADEAQARERVVELCRSAIVGVTHPPIVAVLSPEDRLTR